MDNNIIIALLGSGVIATIISTLFQKLSKDKTDKLNYITNERKIWREDIRKATVEIRKLAEKKEVSNDCQFNSIKQAKAFFQVRLNPEDEEDKKIIRNLQDLAKCIDENKNENDIDKILEKIEIGIACLLKHDWERSKYEVKSNFYRKYLKFIIILILSFVMFYLVLFFGKEDNNFLISSFLNIFSHIKISESSSIFIIRSFVFPLSIFVVLLVPIIYKFFELLFFCICRKCFKGRVGQNIKSFFGIPYRISVKKNEKINVR